MSDLQTDYKISLPPDVRLRYESKTKGIGGIDPYTIHEKDYGRDRMAWPDVTYIDVYTYLVCSSNAYTKEQMKHYKALDGYKLFQDGWIKEMLHKLIGTSHVLKAKMTHSMSVAEKPLEPWVVISQDGSIESAHCTCMAGLSEACSHITAVLFCLESCARVMSPSETTPTDLPAYWLFPTAGPHEVQFSKLKDMNLESAAKKRRRAMEDDRQQVDKKKTIPSPTKKEVEDFFKDLHSTHPNAVVLSVVDDYAANFMPKAIMVGLPPDLSTAFLPDLADKPR